MEKLKIFRLDEYSWYVAHNLMEFLNWYNKKIDSIESADDLRELEIIEPSEGAMWSDTNVTKEDIDCIGEYDEMCRGGIGDLKRTSEGIFKLQTFEDVLRATGVDAESLKEPYEIVFAYETKEVGTRSL